MLFAFTSTKRQRVTSRPSNHSLALRASIATVIKRSNVIAEIRLTACPAGRALEAWTPGRCQSEDKTVSGPMLFAFTSTKRQRVTSRPSNHSLALRASIATVIKRSNVIAEIRLTACPAGRALEAWTPGRCQSEDKTVSGPMLFAFTSTKRQRVTSRPSNRSESLACASCKYCHCNKTLQRHR